MPAERPPPCLSLGQAARDALRDTGQLTAGPSALWSWQLYQWTLGSRWQRSGPECAPLEPVALLQVTPCAANVVGLPGPPLTPLQTGPRSPVRAPPRAQEAASKGPGAPAQELGWDGTVPWQRPRLLPVRVGGSHWGAVARFTLGRSYLGKRLPVSRAPERKQGWFGGGGESCWVASWGADPLPVEPVCLHCLVFPAAGAPLPAPVPWWLLAGAPV